MTKEKLGRIINIVFKGSLFLGAITFILLITVMMGQTVGVDLKDIMIYFYILLFILILIWLLLFGAEIYYFIRFKDPSRLANLFFIIIIFGLSIWGYQNMGR